MNTTVPCARCGAPTLGPSPRPGLENLCPRCVMGFAMEDGTVPVAEPAVPALKPHSTFGGYEILEVVGQGGMGVVYRARHLQMDRIVALKTLAPRFAEDTEFRARFLREARVLGSLDHANVVKVWDVGVVGDTPYLAMEFVEGVTLRRLLSEKRLPPSEAIRIVPQLCDALDYAHSRGIVHRDIKPENILIDTRGSVKIADFGIAKIAQSGGGTRVATLTSASVSMGTPHYMAPEQVENTHDVDHRADIYSMGVVFYEMLTGELPLGRFHPPSRKGGVHSRLDQIVMKTLEKAPADRYQHASEVKADLHRTEWRPAPAAAPAGPESHTVALLGMVGAFLIPVMILVPAMLRINIGMAEGCLLMSALILGTLVCLVIGLVKGISSRGSKRGLVYSLVGIGVLGLSAVATVALVFFLTPVRAREQTMDAERRAMEEMRARQEAMKRIPAPVPAPAPKGVRPVERSPERVPPPVPAPTAEPAPSPAPTRAPAPPANRNSFGQTRPGKLLAAFWSRDAAEFLGEGHEFKEGPSFAESPEDVAKQWAVLAKRPGFTDAVATLVGGEAKAGRFAKLYHGLVLDGAYEITGFEEEGRTHFMLRGLGMMVDVRRLDSLRLHLERRWTAAK